MNESPKAAVGEVRNKSLLADLLGFAHSYEMRIEQELKEIGLSQTLFETLAQLARAARPLTLSELAAGQRCAASNITQKMDRLERDRLVRRVDDPTDRRIVLAEITPAGRDRTAAGERILEKYQAELDAALESSDRPVLDRLLAKLK